MTKIVPCDVFAIITTVKHWENPCEANIAASYQEN